MTLRRQLIWLNIIPIGAYFFFQFRSLQSEAAQVSHYSVQFSFLVFATFSLISAALRDREAGPFWTQMGAGAGFWMLATMMESLEVLLEQPRFGTVADVAWVLGYAGILAALFWGSRFFDGWRTRQAIRAACLWLVVAIGVALTILFRLMPSVDRTLVLVLGYVYYTSDALLVFLAILCAFGRKVQQHRRSLRTILVACILFYVFDVIVILRHILFPLDRWTALGYATGYFLLYRAGQTWR